MNTINCHPAGGTESTISWDISTANISIYVKISRVEGEFSFLPCFISVSVWESHRTVVAQESQLAFLCKEVFQFFNVSQQ